MSEHLMLNWLGVFFICVALLIIAAMIESLGNMMARRWTICIILLEVCKKEEILFSELYYTLTTSDELNLTPEEYFRVINKLIEARLLYRSLCSDEDVMLWEGMSLIRCTYGLTAYGYELIENYQTKEGKKKFQNISYLL